MTANLPSEIRSLTKLFRSAEHAHPTASRTTGIFFEFATFKEIFIEAILTSEMLPILSNNAEAVLVISSTSNGCSAIIGFAPRARTALAVWLIEIGLVMQWIRQVCALSAFSIKHLLQ